MLNPHKIFDGNEERKKIMRGKEKNNKVVRPMQFKTWDDDKNDQTDICNVISQRENNITASKCTSF